MRKKQPPLHLIFLFSSVRTNLGVNLLVDTLHELVPHAALLRLLRLVLTFRFDALKSTTNRLATDLSIGAVQRFRGKIVRRAFVWTLGAVSFLWILELRTHLKWC